MQSARVTQSEWKTLWALVTSVLKRRSSESPCFCSGFCSARTETTAETDTQRQPTVTYNCDTVICIIDIQTLHLLPGLNSAYTGRKNLFNCCWKLKGVFRLIFVSLFAHKWMAAMHNLCLFTPNCVLYHPYRPVICIWKGGICIFLICICMFMNWNHSLEIRANISLSSSNSHLGCRVSSFSPFVSGHLSTIDY